MLISRKSARTGVLLFILLAMEQFFYLIDDDSFAVSGSMNYDIFWFALLALFLFWMYISFFMWRICIKYHFRFEITIFIIMIFVSAVQCNILTGQPLLRGLLPQRNFLIILISYFIIRKLFAIEMLDSKTIVKWLVIFGVVSTALFVTQAFLADSIRFVHVNINERYGSARLYVDSVFCVVIAFIGLENFFRYRKYSGLFLVLLTACYELFVSKGRLELFAFSVSIVIGITFFKKFDGAKFGAIIMCLVIGFIFINSQYAETLFSSLSEVYEKGNSLEIRLYGRALYFAQLTKSWKTLLFGCGYPSTLWNTAASRAGFDNNVYLVDNGIFAIAYVYGLLGLLATAIWFVRMFLIAIHLYTRNGRYLYLLFLLFQIILMYNITFWWWKASWTFVTVLFMCMMEHELYDGSEYYNSEGTA